MFAQPILRFKVSIDSPAQTYSTDAIGRDDPINRLPRLPLIVRTHVIVQFSQPPSAATLAALAARGALVLQYLPNNAVLVSVNGRVRLNNLGITSADLIDPRLKMSPLISSGTPAGSSGYYLVELHPDVDPNAGRRLILNMGLELRENPDLLRQHLMVYAPNSAVRATLEFLATQDQVAYIFPASADLIAGIPVSVCGGALTVLGAIGQIIATNGDGWDGPGLNATTLNYVFSHLTAQLPVSATEGEIERAMAGWAAVIQLTWQPATDPLGNRTVNILFATGAHGDDFPFDGPGGVIAHTFYPAPPNPEPLAGDMHFDDAESWHVGTAVDVFSVALHELGHALGLGHSDNPNDVMYPYFKIVTTLAPGDIAAIQTLYAARSEITGPLTLTVNPPPATTNASTISLTGAVTGGSGGAVVTWVTSTGASGTASVAGGSWVAANIPLAMGLNSITVTAMDSSGSVSQTVNVTRLINTPLVLTVTPPPPTTTSAILSLTGTVSGGSGGIAVTWVTTTGASGGATINGTSWTITGIPLAIGLNSITVTAADSSGSVSQTVNVTRLASTALVLTVNPPPATTTSASISLSGTVSGGTGGAFVTWITSTGASDGATISGTNWSILSIPLAMGLNSITVTAVDSADRLSVTVNVTRLVSAPLVLTVNPPPATTTSATISLSGTVSGGSGGIAITWVTSTAASDGGTINGTSWTITGIPLAIGLNSITVTAADPTESVSVTVNVTRTAITAGPDTTGPTLTITFPSSTSVATTLASLTFMGTASDRSGVASVTWSTNTGGAGSASGTTEWSATIPLLVGLNQVIISATDTVGNVSWRSVVVSRR